MKEFKGTKGKWGKISTIGNKQDKDCFYKVIKNEDGNVIAEVKGTHHGISNNECIYNTKLIASAPNLLEALQDLVFLHECEQEGISEGIPTPEQWNEALEKAQKAINKALD